MVLKNTVLRGGARLRLKREGTLAPASCASTAGVGVVDAAAAGEAGVGASADIRCSEAFDPPPSDTPQQFTVGRLHPENSPAATHPLHSDLVTFRCATLTRRLSMVRGTAAQQRAYRAAKRPETAVPGDQAPVSTC